MSVQAGEQAISATDGSYALTLYRAMREANSNGGMAPGTRIRETELATRYGVSRTPVREALKKLEVDGLVECAGQGLVVCDPTLNEILDAYLVREVLEGLAMRLATERAIDTDRLRIEASKDQMVAAIREGDTEGAIKMCNVFDDLFFTAANSERLYRMIQVARASQAQTMRTNVRGPGRLRRQFRSGWGSSKLSRSGCPRRRKKPPRTICVAPANCGSWRVSLRTVRITIAARRPRSVLFRAHWHTRLAVIQS